MNGSAQHQVMGDSDPWWQHLTNVFFYHSPTEKAKMVVFLIQQVMMADCYPCICVMCSCVLTALLKARGLLLHTAAVIVCGCSSFKHLNYLCSLYH